MFSPSHFHFEAESQLSSFSVLSLNQCFWKKSQELKTMQHNQADVSVGLLFTPNTAMEIANSPLLIM